MGSRFGPGQLGDWPQTSVSPTPPPWLHRVNRLLGIGGVRRHLCVWGICGKQPNTLTRRCIECGQLNSSQRSMGEINHGLKGHLGRPVHKHLDRHNHKDFQWHWRHCDQNTVHHGDLSRCYLSVEHQVYLQWCSSWSAGHSKDLPLCLPGKHCTDPFAPVPSRFVQQKLFWWPA